MTSQTDSLPQAAAVSYLRVSTKEQAERDGDPEGYSIPAQRDANRRKAEALGAVITAEFVDRGESARSAHRPELQRLLAYVQDNTVAFVIVHKVDRLARNRIDDVEINLALQKAGVTLVSATENIDETPSGMLLHGIMSTIAEFYSRNLANEVVKGMSQKARTGGTPNRAPLGYRNVRAVNDDGREVRTIAVDPERGPLITWAYRAYATGNWTLLKLAAELETRGLRTVATPSQPSRPVRPNIVHKILTSPYYKGEVIWRGASYPGRHTPLIDEVTWQRVQTVLSTHRVGEKQRAHPHYLKSTVFCGACGSRFVVNLSTNRYGAKYPYFMCLGRHQKRTGCTQKALLISAIEERVEDLYADVELPPELREQIERFLRDELAASRAAAEREHGALTIQRQRLTNERAKLLQAHYAGAVPVDLLKVEQDRIAAQLAHIEDRLQRASEAAETVEESLTLALDLLSDCHEAYRRASDSVRRLYNQAFFEQIFISDEGISAVLAEPFRTLIGPEVVHAVQTGTDDADPATEGPVETSDDAQDTSPDAWTAEDLCLIRTWPPRSDRTRTKQPAPQWSCGAGWKQNTLVPPAGFEPAPLPPEGSALSPELRGPSRSFPVRLSAVGHPADGGASGCRERGPAPPGEHLGHGRGLGRLGVGDRGGQPSHGFLVGVFGRVHGHVEAALVVPDHQAQELHVERRAGQLREPGELLLGRHPWHEGAAGHVHRVAGVSAVPAHPGHDLAAGGPQTPQREPPLHPAGLVGLGRRDVEREAPHLRLRAAFQRQVGHLDPLEVVPGHVPGEPGVDRVGRRRALAPDAQGDREPAAEQEQGRGDDGRERDPQRPSPAGRGHGVPSPAGRRIGARCVKARRSPPGSRSRPERRFPRRRGSRRRSRSVARRGSRNSRRWRRARG
jgi:site-specific DNA recombinase